MCIRVCAYVRVCVLWFPTRAVIVSFFNWCAFKLKKKKEVVHYKREWDTNRPSHSFILIPTSPVLSQPLPSFNHACKHKRAHSTDGLKPPPFLSLKLFRTNCSTDRGRHIHPSSSCLYPVACSPLMFVIICAELIRCLFGFWHHMHN